MQFTVTFNSKLVSCTEAIESWFDLAARGAEEPVSGSIQLKIQFGDVLKNSTAGLASVASQLGLTSSTSGAGGNNNNNAPAPALKASTDGVPSRPPDEAVLPKSAVKEEVIEDLMGSGKAFIVHPEDTDVDAYDKLRVGPAATSLVKIGAATVAFGQKNLQVNHSSNSYTMQGVRGDCAVTAGKWYFEVKLDSNGQAQIGYCTEDYDGAAQNPKGDSWSFDGNRVQKLRNGNGIAYGNASWSSGDVIGVFLDMSGPTLKFSRNGADLGVAYGSSEMGKAKTLVPFCLLARNMKVTFNFGATAFRYPQHNYNQLHLPLDEKQIQGLGVLFHKYCRIANEAQEDEDYDPSIFEAGTDAYMADLGITDDMDPSIFIIAWKLGCATPWVISKAEWMNGWSVQGAATTADMKQKLATWRKDLEDPKVFTTFYNWVFDHMRGDKRILDWEQVKILWQVVLSSRKWPLFPKWIEFLEKTKTKAINQDLWSMIWEFMKAFPKDLKAYDPSESAWPGKLDEFAEYMESGSLD